MNLKLRESDVDFTFLMKAIELNKKNTVRGPSWTRGFRSTMVLEVKTDEENPQNLLFFFCIGEEKNEIWKSRLPRFAFAFSDRRCVCGLQ